MKNLFDLTGKVAVVTGGTKGLGLESAKGYAFYGADVAVIDLPDADSTEIVSEIEKLGKKVKVYGCDVSNEDNVKETVESIIADFGKIDILLNNAGIGVGLGDIFSLEREKWDKSISVNVTGYMLMCKYVAPHMRDAGYGKIVMMASADAFLGDKNPLRQRLSYQVGKGGVVAMVQALGCYLAQYGITVNGIAPGTIPTDQSRPTLMANKDFVKMYETRSPQSRFGEQDELVGTVIYLSSDASSHTVGRVIIVDGGLQLAISD